MIDWSHKIIKRSHKSKWYGSKSKQQVSIHAAYSLTFIEWMILYHQLLDANTDDFSELLKSSGNLGVNGIADSTKRKTPEGAISEVSLEHSV